MSERNQRGEAQQKEQDKVPVKESSKSLFETAREIGEREKREAELAERQRQKEEAEQAYAERERYGEALEEERRELIRLKQGVIEESDTIFEETPEKPHYTLWQKIKNFFYHNIWWLGFAVFFAGVAVVLVVDSLKQVEPDIIVMILAKDEMLNMKSSEISTYFEQFCEDLNGDGQVEVGVYYIPVSANGSNYLDGSSTKLMVEYHSAEAMIVFADDACKEIIVPEDTLANLEDYFPDNPNVQDYAFLLKDTDFAEKIGYSASLIDTESGSAPAKPDDDLYIGIRAPRERSFATAEQMQESFDRSLPVLEKLVAALTQRTND